MKEIKLMGLPLPIFLVVGLIICIGVFTNTLPTSMVGAFALLLFLGAVLGFIGDRLPIVNTYLGGGPIVIIFGVAAMVYFNIIPSNIVQVIKSFMETGALKNAEEVTIGYKAGFLDFYIAALITGSILGMSRSLLIKAAVRYLPVIMGGVVIALLGVGLVGAAMGYGFNDAIVYVGIPIMGGGMGAGAVPIAEVFADGLGVQATDILSRLVPAVALGNAAAIVFGGLLNRFGKSNPKFSGEGKLLRSQDDTSLEATEVDEVVESDIKIYGTGIFLATSFMILGSIISKFVFDGAIHFYAWMIISVGVVKALGLLPRKYELYAQKWYQFVAGNFTLALLAGIGIAYTNLGQVIDAFSFTYLILVLVVVLGAIIGTMLVGRLLGFYEIEAAITAGLCMANMGGTGDVAVLSAAERMELMPFAQISSRIGGTIIILIATLLSSILF